MGRGPCSYPPWGPWVLVGWPEGFTGRCSDPPSVSRAAGLCSSVRTCLRGRSHLQVSRLSLALVGEAWGPAHAPPVCTQLDLLPSSLKLSNEPGPASIYHSKPVAPPVEAGRTALHVACEREDNDKVSWVESMCAGASVHVCK